MFKNFLKEFKEFALRGSVLDLAIGIIVGSGFNTVVNSLVKNIVLPPIGLVLNRVDFSTLFVSLSTTQYSTLAEAQKAGAPTLNYGLFFNDLISFLITAFVVFLMVRWINKMRRRREAGKELEPTTKTCPECMSVVPLKAKRCPFCTSSIE
jgi:large conductance mechanosensitive channel